MTVGRTSSKSGQKLWWLFKSFLTKLHWDATNPRLGRRLHVNVKTAVKQFNQISYSPLVDRRLCIRRLE